MTVTTIDQEALQVLRYFNAAVSTVRLYPENAPQVKKSIEKAFREMELYVLKNGEFSFGYDSDKPYLCLELFFPEKPEKVDEFPIFNHLKLLGLPNALFTKSIDREQFGKIIRVFTTSVKEIEQSGGSSAFVHALKVSLFFPDSLEDPAMVQAEMEREYGRQKTAVIDVPDQYLLFLYGKQTNPRALQNLKKLFESPNKAMAVTASAIARLLKGMQRGKHLISPIFPQVLSRVDQLLSADHKHTVAVNTASFLSRGLKAPALCVLLSQQYPTEFGRDLYLALAHLLSNETFAQVARLFEQQTGKTDKHSSLNKEARKLFVDSYNRLMETKRGKQFAAARKVDSLIRQKEKQQRQQRTQTGVESLLKGDIRQLQSAEFLTALPKTIETFMIQHQDGNLDTVIEQLTEASSKDTSLPEHLVQGLLIIADKCIEHKNWNHIDQLIPPLLEWVNTTDTINDFYKKAVRCLQTFAIEGWRVDRNEWPDQVAASFYAIRTGRQAKPDEIVELIAISQDTNFDPDLCSNQLEEFYLDSDETRIRRRLMHQGISAGRIVLQALLDSDQTEKRLALLELLTDLDGFTPQVVLERINNPMPWYNKRNLIKLISETGDEHHVKNIIPFLNYDNERVQQEALSCIYRLSGTNKKKHLLAALPQTAIAIRSQLVKALLPFADEEVADSLIQLLEERHSFTQTMDDELVLHICDGLGRSLSVKALKPLKVLMEEIRQKEVYYQENTVFRAARNAVHQVESHDQSVKKQHAQVQKVRRQAAKQAAMIKSTALLQKKKTEAETIDDSDLLDQLLARGEQDKAKKLLMKMIIKAARKKRFSDAEAFRQQLIEVDPMALQEIIKAAEIIEQEKSNAVEKEHLQIWSDLHASLSEEEFNHLYFLMDKISCLQGEQLVEQGEKHPHLYFINSGTVKLFCRENDEEVLIGLLEKGSIFGTESFFNVSVWTMGAACHTDVELLMLSLTDLRGLRDEFPGLETKLREYCEKITSVDDFFKARKAERRRHERVPVSGKAHVALLDEAGQDSGRSARGDFDNISLGGVSFLYRISSKEKAQDMLGLNVAIALPLDRESEKSIQVKGMIIAVRGRHIMESEYSVHICFTDLLSEEVLKQCIQAGSSDDSEKDDLGI